MPLTLATLIVAEGAIGLCCLLLSVILLGVRRLFLWPDLRAVFVSFSVLCASAGTSHLVGLLAAWDRRWLLVWALATVATAFATIVATLLLFFLLQGWRNTLLNSHLRAKAGLN